MTGHDDAGPGHDHPPLGGVGGGQECLACPVCVLLQALGTASPDAVQHLVAAARELGLAVQAVLAAASASAERPGPARVQRIRVD